MPDLLKKTLPLLRELRQSIQNGRALELPDAYAVDVDLYDAERVAEIDVLVDAIQAALSSAGGDC